MVDKVKIKMEKLVTSPNIAEMLDKDTLADIGMQVTNGYVADRSSRSEWEKRVDEGMKLALQVIETKSFPWVNCSSVKFPLVTVAALQFLARISILTKGRQIAKVEVIGNDPQGFEFYRAKRISAHMSYQLVEEDTNWIDDDEKAKFAACIVGCAFKKTYFDPVGGVNISEHVPASNFVVDYFTKTLDKANRATQVITMTENDIQERVRSGVFLEMDSDFQSTPEFNQMQVTADEIEGVTRTVTDSINTFEILEQHTFLDLDGDGYKEPYIVFVRRDTGQVLRIVARYFDEGDVHRVNDAKIRRYEKYMSETKDEKVKKAYEADIKKLQEAKDNHIVRIDPMQFFTKIPFIPSPDGGFYDLGFSSLLGPVNASVNTIINQLIDAGTMSVTAGGFLGRGVKIKGGRTAFDPFEWKPVDSTGDDLSKNIYPLPVREPSAVLFNMLTVLIQYGEKISGATDIMTGVSPGQNTPAETSRNTIEQGMKLFSGIYARMHRAFKDELGKLYKLNQLYLDINPKYVQLTSGDSAMITQDDYKKGSFKVMPAADVQVVSESQRQQKAIMLKQAAAGSPLYNKYLVEKEFLEAFDISGIDMLLPDPAGPNALPQPVNPALEMEKQKMAMEKEQSDREFQLAIVELQGQVQLNQAKINELNAKAEKMLAEANGVDIGHQIAAINAQVGAARAHQEGMTSALKIMQRTVDQRHNQQKLEIDKGNQQNGNNRARPQGMETPSSDAGTSQGVTQGESGDMQGMG